MQPTGNQVRGNSQLIDAERGAHLWTEQFDAPRADQLQTQDEIVTRLARSMYLQLPEVEVARFNRTPASNPDAEDLALQCQAAVLRYEAISLAGDFRLCDQTLAADPNNVRALTYLALTLLPSRGPALLCLDADAAEAAANEGYELDLGPEQGHGLRTIRDITAAKGDAIKADELHGLARAKFQSLGM